MRVTKDGLSTDRQVINATIIKEGKTAGKILITVEAIRGCFWSSGLAGRKSGSIGTNWTSAAST
jgi:hypothetical protein